MEVKGRNLFRRHSAQPSSPFRANEILESADRSAEPDRFVGENRAWNRRRRKLGADNLPNAA